MINRYTTALKYLSTSKIRFWCIKKHRKIETTYTNTILSSGNISLICNICANVQNCVSCTNRKKSIDNECYINKHYYLCSVRENE